MDKNNSYQHNCACNCGNSCRALLDKIQKISFAIDETILYLDVYPHSREALSYYHQLLNQKKLLTEEYEAKCGPLSVYGNKSTVSWDWVLSPWPWEYKANI